MAWHGDSIVKLSWVLGLFIILGGSATQVYADATPMDASSAIGDPRIIVQDPSCPVGAYCVDLTYTGPSMFFLFDPLVFSVPNPPGEYPVPPIYTCESNVFLVNLALPIFSHSEFTGCLFDLGYLTQNEPLTISSLGGSVELTLPPNFSCPSCSDDIIDLSPEPGTAILYLTGLIFLIAFCRKYFGVNSNT
jgi:hypothetical protein